MLEQTISHIIAALFLSGKCTLIRFLTKNGKLAVQQRDFQALFPLNRCCIFPLKTQRKLVKQYLTTLIKGFALIYPLGLVVVLFLVATTKRPRNQMYSRQYSQIHLLMRRIPSLRIFSRAIFLNSFLFIMSPPFINQRMYDG